MESSNSEKIFSKITGTLFLFAVFSLVWRKYQGEFWDFYVPKMFELLILVIALIVLIQFIFIKASRKKTFEVLLNNKVSLFVIAVLLLLGYLGTLQILKDPNWLSQKNEIILSWLRLIFCFGVLFLIQVLIRFKNKLIEHAFLVVSASPLILWLAFIPKLTPHFIQTWRLGGDAGNANHLAVWIVLSILSSLSYFLFKNHKGRWISLATAFFSFPLLLWSSSRASWLSFLVALVVLLIFFLRKKGWNKKNRLLIFAVIATILVSVNLGFIVLPENSRITVFARNFAPFLDDKVHQQIIQDLREKKDTTPAVFIADNLKSLELNTRYFSNGQDRFFLWQKGSQMMLENPLGLGPGYYNIKPVAEIDGNQGPHSLWFEVGLTFGWLGLFVWLLFLGFVAKKVIDASRGADFVPAVVLVSFTHLIITSFFLDTFTMRPLWLIIAIILALDFTRPPLAATGNSNAN